MLCSASAGSAKCVQVGGAVCGASFATLGRPNLRSARRPMPPTSPARRGPGQAPRARPGPWATRRPTRARRAARPRRACAARRRAGAASRAGAEAQQLVSQELDRRVSMRPGKVRVAGHKRAGLRIREGGGRGQRGQRSSPSTGAQSQGAARPRWFQPHGICRLPEPPPGKRTRPKRGPPGAACGGGPQDRLCAIAHARSAGRPCPCPRPRPCSRPGSAPSHRP